MQHWRISYSGKLRLRTKDGAEPRLVEVGLQLDWRACTQNFDFDTDMSIATVARSNATEPWSKALFQRLQAMHQTHHEQWGRYSGELKIQEFGSFPIRLHGVRDHSYGPHRDWRHFHRYAMQFFHTEDGTVFNAAVLAMSQPGLTRFEYGYVMHPDGLKVPLDWCDIPLDRLGVQPGTVDSYRFEFGAGGVRYRVDCEILEKPSVFFGPEWEAQVIEQMAVFRVEDVERRRIQKGWGISEWEYRNLSGKPVLKNSEVKNSEEDSNTNENENIANGQISNGKIANGNAHY